LSGSRLTKPKPITSTRNVISFTISR